MSDYLKNTVTGTAAAKLSKVPQSKPVSKDQKPNNAGGYTFTVSGMARLNRFLMLGTQGGTYYQREQDITKQNIDNIVKLIGSNGLDVAKRVHQVSTEKLALKQDPTLFVWALLMRHGDDATRSWVYSHTSDVARTGTHVLRLVDFITTLGGWSRGKRNAIGSWFTNKNAEQLAFQAAKYRGRYGWTMNDLAKVAHPSSQDDAVNQVITHLWGKLTVQELGEKIGPNALTASAEVHQAFEKGDVKAAIRIVDENRLSWEMIPTQMLADSAVWDVLVPNSGYQALLRNLNRLTTNGWLTPGSQNRKWMIEQLGNEEFVKRSGIHPFAIYLSSRAYGAGRGTLGSKTWTPVTGITDALDDAYFMAFHNVEPTGQSYFVGVDCSGSMWWGNAGGMAGITPGEAAAALALVWLRTEPDVQVMGFNTQMQPIDLSKKTTISAVEAAFKKVSWGGTDCARMFEHAKTHNWEIDNFVTITDNETWAGRQHPHVALEGYRKASGRNSRSLVVGMTATDCSIADPNDPGMLDVAGLSADLPQLSREFFLGKV